MDSHGSVLRSRSNDVRPIHSRISFPRTLGSMDLFGERCSKLLSKGSIEKEESFTQIAAFIPSRLQLLARLRSS